MRRSAVPVLLGLLAVALVVLLAVAMSRSGDSTTADTLDAQVQAGTPVLAPGADKPLPWLTPAKSGTTQLQDFRGQVVVLNFWASWCTGCKNEAALLERTHRRLKRSGAGIVLGMNRTDYDADSKAFLKKHALTFPSLRDADQKLGQQYGVTAMPETFVLDAQGQIRAIARGEVTEAFLDGALRRAGVDEKALTR